MQEVEERLNDGAEYQDEQEAYEFLENRGDIEQG